jgi:HAD superfamily hydrolase (TIGR01509 family)
VRVLIFDCDGVLAETERDGHLPAFNRAFEELNLPIRWTEAEYAEKLRVSGGKERMATSLTPELLRLHGLSTAHGGQRALLERLHARKTQIFEEMLEARPLAARDGIARIIGAANTAGWRLAVASTSSEQAVRAVVGRVLGPVWTSKLAIFAGDVVRAKKPDPAIYELALEQLGARREDTIVIEDSRSGLLAARAAGLSCVVTVSDFTAAEDFTEAALVLSSLGDPDKPMTVIANRTAVPLRGYVRLTDLDAILSSGPGVVEAGGEAAGQERVASAVERSTSPAG